MKYTSSEGSVPVPDPTLLTTAALTLSITNLKDLFESKLEAQEKLLSEKITNNFLMDTKRHRETREWLATINANRLESKHDKEKAIDVAFKSQEKLFNQQRDFIIETTAKSEMSFTKQLEALAKEALLSREALSERIYALKEERRLEGVRKEGWLMPMIVVGIISALSLVVQIIAMMK